MMADLVQQGHANLFPEPRTAGAVQGPGNAHDRTAKELDLVRERTAVFHAPAREGNAPMEAAKLHGFGAKLEAAQLFMRWLVIHDERILFQDSMNVGRQGGQDLFQEAIKFLSCPHGPKAPHRFILNV